MSSGSTSFGLPLRTVRRGQRAVPRLISGVRARPELPAVLAIAAVLNLWGLSINGWANTFYSAAVRSMTTSWHDFLFASLDKTGLMTVDKPPLALWVQALSARIFGFNSLSILVPEALMGIAAAGLTYDLVRRRFGRPAGFAAGIALALTPITVAISRHNNPDQLLILCCVAALWFAVRALEDGRTKWLVWAGVCVGLGFETKMAVALFVVPGIALAYLWIAPVGRLRALRQLTLGGVAMAVVGLAWPVLVTLTPAADRPWISGTSDNSIWSLIFNYNGVGRVTGQTGAPGAFGGGGGAGGGGGGAFGGNTGVFRLLQSGLGDQAGWLIGFAIVAGLGLLVATRLRRSDPRSGWLIAVGGSFAVSAVVFSYASGIFHPYYVSFLAPWTAMLVGAGVGMALGSERLGRIVGPLAIAGGAVTELVVLGNLSGSLSWAKPLVIVVGIAGAAALAIRLSPRLRMVALAVTVAALLAAPATWATETLGHATSSTFPAGGPASASMGGFGGPGGRTGGSHFRLRGGTGGGGFSGPPPGAAPGAGASGAAGGAAAAGGAGAAAGAGAAGGAGASGGAGATSGSGGVQSLFGGSSSSTRGGVGRGRGGFGGGRGGFGGGAGMFGGNDASLQAAAKYSKAHGGGTIGVESQESAASSILAGDTNVAGLGGFSGRESTVSTQWLAMEVRDRRLRWILGDSQGSAGGFGGFGGDSREGSTATLAIAEKVGRKVTFTSGGTTVTMYDLQGKASAILAAAGAS
jgi:4-amino-4-deoxy-L-arabinose transferase-like glycosyltransferase